MPRLTSSAAYRFALAQFGAVAIGLAVLGLTVFLAMHVAFTRQLDGMLTDEMQELAGEYRAGGFRELRNSISEREASGAPYSFYYAVYAPNGGRLAGALDSKRPETGIHDIFFIDPREGPDSARAIVIDIAPDERLVVAADREWIERIDRTVITVFGFAFLGASLLGLLGAFALGAFLRGRLQSFSGTAEAIIGGDIRGRMPIGPREDEFDQLARTLNRMLDRIESLVDNLRQVSSDIAHDLRTPLARLRNRLEEGMRSDLANPAGREVIEDALLRVDEVLNLFAAILRISEVESAEPQRHFAPIDLSAVASDLAESYEPAVRDGGRELIWSIEPDLAVVGDRDLLSQAGANLIENAQRHTPPGTIIRLTTTGAGGLACLRVVDSGPGVPKAERGRIIRRFTRLDTSRKAGGYGLGLSLVSAVAKLHGGRLVLDDANPGLVVTIELPQAKGQSTGSNCPNS
jgi:signal transduction histidine kinase